MHKLLANRATTHILLLVKAISHHIFHNLKSFLYGERWFKGKCLMDQKRRFSEHSMISHLKDLSIAI